MYIVQPCMSNESGAAWVGSSLYSSMFATNIIIVCVCVCLSAFCTFSISISQETCCTYLHVLASFRNAQYTFGVF